MLFFPGSVPRYFEKALESGADAVCMDLEDAVAADLKDDARANAVDALRTKGVQPPTLVVRVNHPGSVEGQRDLEAIAALDAAADHPLTLMIPKVDGPSDLDSTRDRLGANATRTSLIAMVETVRGVANVEEIARAQGVGALLFGGLDLSIDLGAAMEWEPLLHARSRVVLAARLGGVAAIDMPFLGVSDPEGLKAESDRVRKLGFDGKAAIHPSQVEVVRDAFRHSAQDVARARQIVEVADGVAEGAFIVRGGMVDRPAIEAARRVVAWADEHGS